MKLLCAAEAPGSVRRRPLATKSEVSRIAGLLDEPTSRAASTPSRRGRTVRHRPWLFTANATLNSRFMRILLTGLTLRLDVPIWPSRGFKRTPLNAIA